MTKRAVEILSGFCLLGIAFLCGWLLFGGCRALCRELAAGPERAVRANFECQKAWVELEKAQFLEALKGARKE